MNDRQVGSNDQQTGPCETILVTGGAGFVGANLVLHLAQYGYRVVAYGRSLPPPIVECFWQPARRHIVFEAGSVTDPGRLKEVTDRHRPSVIIHAAAATAVDFDTEAQRAKEIAEVNLMGTIKLLELARRLGVRRMIYVGSAGVYGSTDPQLPVPESAPLQVKGLYLLAKEASERLCHRWAELFGLDTVVIRLGQPYGPMERDTGVRTVLSPTYQLARIALIRGVVRVPLPDYSCDWTYTVDVAKAIRLVTGAEALQHRVYNLSNGQSRNLTDVIAELSVLIPDARFEWVASGQSADIDTRSDPRRGPLDISRLRDDVGYEPAYALERGLPAALPWWREMIKATT